jgi:hypothetical protein
VNALELLQDAFGYRIDYDEPREERRYGDAPKRRTGPNELILQADQSEESQQMLAARAIAKKLLPEIFTKLGIVPGTESKGAGQSIIGLIASRILLPTRWFISDARRAAFNLFELKQQYPGVNWDTLAWRMLEADDEPSIIAVIDDGSVSARRGNQASVNRKLTDAEEEAAALARETDEPATIRKEGWTATAWPTRGVPFRRIFVRSVPDLL